MRPRCLDLFCGGGGATKGLQRAGFYVVGVDIKKQPHYCGDEFYQADAMTFPLEGYDCYWASPPCQDYAATRYIPGRDSTKYPRLIAPTRERLKSSGKPYVLENSPRAPLENALLLCGTMFGLKTWRHRKFETRPECYMAPAKCNHSVAPNMNGRLAWYFTENSPMIVVAGHLFSKKAGSVALGIDWMTCDELAQAIPPVYAEYLGNFMMQAVKGPP